MKKLLAVAMLSLFLVGCGEPKLDMSSEETSKASMKVMKEKLSPEDAKRLDKAATRVVAQAAFLSNGDKEEMFSLMKAKLDGKTAQEIIEMGEGKAK